MKHIYKLLSFKSLILSIFILFIGTSTYAETTFEKIKRTGKVTVGTEAAFPPFEFVKDGKIVGYGKDILDYINSDFDYFEESNLKLKIQKTSNDTYLRANKIESKIIKVVVMTSEKY